MNCMIDITRCPLTLTLEEEGGGGGGRRGEYSQEFSEGLCHPVLEILTLFQTKTCHFLHPFSDPYPFSDLASESCILFANPLPCPSEVNILFKNFINLVV